MENQTNLIFNPLTPTKMHIDLNSCFATIEQQANPLLRGKPIAVAAYPTPNGCILAPSIEAKRYGIKTGMRVKDGQALYPKLIILGSDPWKYRVVHLKLRELLFSYCDKTAPKSIDEFVLDFKNTPIFSKRSVASIAREIKLRIKKEVGEWLTVSIGISTNRNLAKVAAGIHKPDGLDEINLKTFREVYAKLKLTDLCGINIRNEIRLNRVGIYSVTDFYQASLQTLKSAFESVLGYYWYLRLRGFEVDEIEFGRRSYGNSYSIPKPIYKKSELAPILAKLVQKTGFRLRKAGFLTAGVHLSIHYKDHSFWHQGHKLNKVIFDSRDIYKEAYTLLQSCPYEKLVHTLFITCFNLVPAKSIQLELFEDVGKKQSLTQALDSMNQRYGDYVVIPANMLETRGYVPDRIAFGGVKELKEMEEFIIGT